MSVSKISDFSDSSSGESLAFLTKKAKETSRLCDDHFLSIASKVELPTANQLGIVPDWIFQHVQNTCQLNNAYLDLKAREQEIPPKTVRILRLSQEKMRKIASILKPSLFTHLLHSFDSLSYLDSSRLFFLSKERPIEESTRAWHLNLSLMRSLIERTKDEKMRKLLSFLALNYLAKVAPVCIEDLNLDKMTTQTLSSRFQQGLLHSGISYNRESAVFDEYLREDISEAFVPSSGNEWKITDTDDFSSLLPITFHVLKNHLEDPTMFWEKEIYKAIKLHFSSFPEDPLSHFMEKNLLIDCTDFLENTIHVSQNGDAEKSEQKFNEKMKHLEESLYQAISDGVERYVKKYPDKGKTEEENQALKIFIFVNLQCICRTSIRGIGVLKTLPLFYDEKYFRCPSGTNLLGEKNINPEKFSRMLLDTKVNLSSAKLEEFLNHSGLRLGSVRGRKALLDFISLEELIENTSGFCLSNYTVRGYQGEGFESPASILNTELMQRLKKRFLLPSSFEEKGFHVLGKATLLLFEGLLKEIPENVWFEIQHRFEIKELLQTSFYRILDHLAMAELQRKDFPKCAQSLELAHAELFNLLIILIPYEEKDFAEIYKNSLICIPESLKHFIFPGLAKGSMNVLAGFLSILKNKRPNFEAAYHEGSHFESTQLLGKGRSLLEVLKKDGSEIDLYLAEFNPNVNLSLDHSRYISGDPIEEISILLKEKQPSKYFTVMVDTTIDYKDSKNLHALLESLSPLIHKGILQVVVYYSGQKFSMLGMDNYYGAPFCCIHNDDDKWKDFSSLWTSEAHKTDFFSFQWFCLSNKYASKEIDEYRGAIFENTKVLLNQIPSELINGQHPFIKVCPCDESVDSCFIDIKITGEKASFLAQDLKQKLFQIFAREGGKIHTRGGYGFYHPNVTFFKQGYDQGTTIRINPGLDAKENKLIMQCLQELTMTL